jgi:GAF domain-containing protein
VRQTADVTSRGGAPGAGPHPDGVEPAVHDADRLAAVSRSGLLSTARQDGWDSLTALAARLLGAPMAFLTVVDDERSAWLATCGVDTSADERPGGPVRGSFCQYVIADRAPFVVSDASRHPRTRDNPAVTEMGVRAWAGFPVLDADGHALGSFCVMDVEPRTWSEDDIATLGVLAQAASSQISLVAAFRAEAAAHGELDRAQRGETQARARLEQLADVTLRLLAADTLTDLTDIIIGQSLSVLGVEGGAVVVREDDHFRLAASGQLPDSVQAIYGTLALDSPLPVCHVGRTGELLVLANRDVGLAFHPILEQVYRDTERFSWAFFPLRLGDDVLGTLAVAWLEDRPEVPPDELELIAAFAAQCTQALARIRANEARQVLVEQMQRFSETIQRSLLTQPAPAAGVNVAVRYLPAQEAEQVGGDWYDVHPAGGGTVISVGDVAGHDQNAAAGMAALRNILRGLAVHSDAGPAALLRHLDSAMERLDLDLFATALVARVVSGTTGAGAGLRVRWSNAGHLPPMVRHPDGTVEVLEREADPFLGITAGRIRDEHTVDLPEGSLLLLYTDGLCERRGESLVVGLDRLARTLSEAAGDLEQVSDLLLDRMLPGPPEDDVVTLLLRA